MSRKFLRIFSGGIVIQALSSAASFGVSLILIRHTANTQYGYYVLISNAILLLVALQNAFIQPPMVMRMIRGDHLDRAQLIGGLWRGQRRVLAWSAGSAAVVIALLGLTGVIDRSVTLLVLAAIGAALAVLFREFFRMVLMAHRRPNDVLKADLLYATALLSGAMLATMTVIPAIVAIGTLGLAAILGGVLSSRALWCFEVWNPRGAPSMLIEMAPLGIWSAAGSAIHWTFSQGYNYLVAGMFDVASVAVLAATRLLLMPVNLLSTGIGSLMLPTASSWLAQHGPATVFRRLLLFAAALVTLSLCYFAVMWLCRDWIFTHVMKKQFEHRDMLLLAWTAVFMVMVVRDQLLYLPGACGQFRSLAGSTLLSALVSLLVSYVAVQKLGLVGAPLGVLAGELCNVAGITLLSLREIRLSRNERTAMIGVSK
jgi:O-antigen/teichoic acid export membrane protein